MYESPVTILFGEMRTQYEDECFKTVQSYGFDVSKEELTKALQYDREQYSKGYKDGYAKAINEFAERLKEKEEEIINNLDVQLECKRCAIWKVKEINEIADELKGE